MVKPRFTFCIPNLNKIEYLPACIDSMLAQDCGDWQCVFVDGYSTDGCWEYMQRFAGDSRFRLLRGLKQGMYADWNYCLDQVETEYFYILTSDDICYPSLISTTVQVLDRFKDVDACHFQYALIDRDGSVLNTPEDCIKERYPIYVDVNRHAHRRSGICESILHYAYGTIYTTLTSLVFRKSLLSKIGGFPTSYGSVGDYDWTMRLGFFTDIIYLPILLATWRIYPEQATAQADRMQVDSYYRISQKNLSTLRDVYKARFHKNLFDEKYIISNMKDNYIAAIIQLFMKSTSLNQKLFNLSQLFQLDLFYPVRKLIRRVSANRLYKYDKAEFAYKLIGKYGLQWPPQQIILDDMVQQELPCEREDLEMDFL
jgi:glycosyltransferase involved in cell wall biosynthesis